MDRIIARTPQIAPTIDPISDPVASVSPPAWLLGVLVGDGDVEDVAVDAVGDGDVEDVVFDAVGEGDIEDLGFAVVGDGEIIDVTADADGETQSFALGDWHSSTLKE